MFEDRKAQQLSPRL